MFRCTRLIQIGGAFALVVAVACGSQEERTAAPEPAPAPAPPAAAEAPPAQPAPTAPEPAAPAEAASVTPDAAKGEQLYVTYCSSCHGARGAGDGPVAAGLDPKPAKHNDGAYMNALKNEHLFKITKEGGPAVGKSPMMAPWGGTLSDEQIWDVVAFVRSLAQPPYEGTVP
jgi:mono/diheme cytochrome c family protein